MVSFRRGKKGDMSERDAAGEERVEGREPEQAEKIRVNDRRRVNVEGAASAEQGEGASEASAPSTKPTYVEELEQRTRAAEQQARDVQARFEQLRAELRREAEAHSQRLARNADERVRREKAELVAALLPVVDNLRRAMEAAEAGGTLEALMDGLRGTVGGFDAVLAQAGVEPVASVGAPFDPEVHEAVDTVEVEPEREGLVAEEYARGYRMGGQLLRPARVRVGRARADAQAAKE
jgi:molecular chaperone GrpE